MFLAYPPGKLLSKYTTVIRHDVLAATRDVHAFKDEGLFLCVIMRRTFEMHTSTTLQWHDPVSSLFTGQRKEHEMRVCIVPTSDYTYACSC